MGCGSSISKVKADDEVPKSPVAPVTPQERISEIHNEHKKQHLNQNIVHEEVVLKVTDVYDIEGAELGTGISGTVRVCTHKSTKIQYALKTLQLHQIRDDPDAYKQLKDEIDILKALDHPNIVRLEEVYETNDFMYLILELCTGGEMLDRLNSQRGYRYTEQVAADYIKTMVNAVRYIHEHNITHRDLKLENFLLQDPTPESDLKLIDFGLSRHFKKSEKMNVPVGTPYYVAPEVLKGNYDEKCDMWSLGVITYMLLSGTPPFPGNSENDILNKVKKGQYDLTISKFDNVSDKAKDFIKKLLIMEPKKRMTAKAAQEHSWLHEWDEEPGVLSSDVADSLKSFHQFSAMKKLVCEVLAYTLIPEQIHDLRKEFEKIDTHNTGEFTAEEFRVALKKSNHLSDEECNQIFNDMDLEHDGKIHWHEFIAATLSKCEYDERNLRLAFDRLDYDHQGFITKANLMDIIGTDANDAEVTAMFDEVDYQHQGKIEFKEFVQIMKQSNNQSSPRRLSVVKSTNSEENSTTKDKHEFRNEIHLKIANHDGKKSS